ncbi:hypothetical protein BC833DRAFT_580044 [Globomyces pollinis-pini]|nr:hypothetical protein BC833DRAFT_580044 [Globomyces pollinis-pini]
MDFNIPTAIKYLPSNWLNQIVIDWSTWRYLKPLQTDSGSQIQLIRLWSDLLTTKGQFIFEHSLSSYRIIHEKQLNEYQKCGLEETYWEHDNPSHIVITFSDIPVQLFELDKSMYKGKYLKQQIRHIIPGEKEGKAQNIIHQKLQEGSLRRIAAVYEDQFSSYFQSVRVVSEGQYKIPTTGLIRQWIELTK